jgi:hypothetical protein
LGLFIIFFFLPLYFLYFKRKSQNDSHSINLGNLIANEEVKLAWKLSIPQFSNNPSQKSLNFSLTRSSPSSKPPTIIGIYFCLYFLCVQNYIKT